MPKLLVRHKYEQPSKSLVEILYNGAPLTDALNHLTEFLAAAEGDDVGSISLPVLLPREEKREQVTVKLYLFYFPAKAGLEVRPPLLPHPGRR